MIYSQKSSRLSHTVSSDTGKIQEIDGLLKQAVVAIDQDRLGDASALLQAAYNLLSEATRAGQTILSIVTLQSVLFALQAGNHLLARDFAGLVIEEMGLELERLGGVYLQQQIGGDRDGLRLTEARAYTYAVTFIPFVQRTRLANLLAGEPELANELEVQAISMLQGRVRPQLDAAGWGLWRYDGTIAARARYWAAAALMRWANTLFDNHDSGEDIQIAQETFEGALLLIDGMPEDRILCDIWNLGGRICWALGQNHYVDAEQWFTRAADAERRLDLQLECARDQSNLGALYIEWADFEKVRGNKAASSIHLQRAATMLEGARDVERALDEPEELVSTLVNLAVLYSRLDKWPQARMAFEEAWSLVPKTGTQRHLHEAQIASNYGTQLFEHQETGDAETWLRRALAASQQFSEPEPRAYLLSLGSLGRLLTLVGSYDEAYGHLSTAVAELERYRTSFRAERTNLELSKTLGWIYEAMIDCCALSHASHPERAAEAFELVEKTKWRIFTTLLRYLPLGLLGPDQEPLVEEEQEILKHASLVLDQPGFAASHPMKAAFDRLDQIWNEMEERHPEYVAFRRQKTITAAQTRSLLDEEVPVLIEYYVGAEYGTVLAFIIKKDSPDVGLVRLSVSPTELMEWVNALSRETDDRRRRNFDRIAQKLHEVLIHPLLLQVPKDVGLCIVPYGPLHNLAFAGLFDGHTYLIERNALVIAPSASALRWWVRKDPGRPERCLIFAATSNVTGEEGPHPDLFFFENLAKRKIARLFPVTLVIAGAEATRERLQKEIGGGEPKVWNVVHIACHGFFPEQESEALPGSGLNSYLVMAGEPGPVKDLTAIEIMTKMRIHATLVTLSACDSGQAQIGSGDELVGLTHAFLLAGTSSVLSSLCYIVQDAGVFITSTFYHLWRQNNSKIRAMQRAQQIALRQRTFWIGPHRFHPQQWSGFQLYGNWQ